MSTLFYIYDKCMRDLHNKYKSLHLTNIEKAVARSSTTVERNSFYKNRKSLCRVLCGIHPSQSSFCPRDEIWWIVLTTILNPDGRWRANELRIRLWQHQASAAQWRLSEPRKRWTGARKSHHKKGQRKLAEAATKKVDDCGGSTKKVEMDNDNLQTGDKKMPRVQKVGILDTRQKVGLKHQQRSGGSVSIRIHFWSLNVSFIWRERQKCPENEI